MIKKIVNGYHLVTAFNWGIAGILIVINVYLYPRLPQVVPVPVGGTSHLMNKLILWAFPLVFLAFAFFLSEKRLNHLAPPPSAKNYWIKLVVLVLQLVLWLVLLRTYTAYFLFI